MNSLLEQKLKEMIATYKECGCDMSECMMNMLNDLDVIGELLKCNGIESVWFLKLLAHNGIVSMFDREAERKHAVEDSFVYILSSKKTKLTKIGYSSNVKQRIKALQNSGPDGLVLKCLIKGGTETEGMLHKKYADKRKHGEWFSLSDEDIESLKSISLHANIE